MEAILKVNAKDYTRLWEEKWRLLERKFKVDEERTLNYMRTRKPNHHLDLERKDLFYKINRVNEYLNRAFPKSLMEHEWFQGLLAGLLMLAALCLGYLALSS